MSLGFYDLLSGMFSQETNEFIKAATQSIGIIENIFKVINKHQQEKFTTNFINLIQPLLMLPNN